MSDLHELTSRLLDGGYVICVEKTGDTVTVLLRRSRPGRRRVFRGTGRTLPEALADAADEAAILAA